MADEKVGAEVSKIAIIEGGNTRYKLKSQTL